MRSRAQNAAIAESIRQKSPGLYRPIGTTGSPLKMAAMLHIKQPRSSTNSSASLMPAAPKPPSTPTY